MSQPLLITGNALSHIDTQRRNALFTQVTVVSNRWFERCQWFESTRAQSTLSRQPPPRGSDLQAPSRVRSRRRHSLSTTVRDDIDVSISISTYNLPDIRRVLRSTSLTIYNFNFGHQMRASTLVNASNHVKLFEIWVQESPTPHKCLTIPTSQILLSRFQIHRRLSPVLYDSFGIRVSTLDWLLSTVYLQSSDLDNEKDLLLIQAFISGGAQDIIGMPEIDTKCCSLPDTHLLKSHRIWHHRILKAELGTESPLLPSTINISELAYKDHEPRQCIIRSSR